MNVVSYSLRHAKKALIKDYWMYISGMYPLIIAQCLLPFFAHGQKINRKEVRDFMNQYLTEKYPRDKAEPVIYMKRKPSMESVVSYYWVTTKDSIEDWYVIEPNFTVADSAEIAESLKNAGRYRFSKRDWQNGRLRTFSKTKKYFKRQDIGERNYILLLKSTKTQYHYRYASTPVFYRNYSKAIFYRGYICGGLCGSAGIGKGKWCVESGKGVAKDNVLRRFLHRQNGYYFC